MNALLLHRLKLGHSAYVACNVARNELKKDQRQNNLVIDVKYLT